mmetsp:Transcript_20874/g.43619  ORF Transcript_20874/g.43619 Transcript_20874/m.43619 type:complete len:123 (+) Transcript_20874:2428-2796(+)
MVSNQAYTGSLLFSCRNKQPTQTGKMSNFKPRFLSLVLELGKMGDTPPIKGSVKYIMRWGSHMQGVLCTSMMEWECHLTEKAHKMTQSRKGSFVSLIAALSQWGVKIHPYGVVMVMALSVLN